MGGNWESDESVQDCQWEDFVNNLKVQSMADEND